MTKFGKGFQMQCLFALTFSQKLCSSLNELLVYTWFFGDFSNCHTSCRIHQPGSDRRVFGTLQVTLTALTFFMN